MDPSESNIVKVVVSDQSYQQIESVSESVADHEEFVSISEVIHDAPDINMLLVSDQSHEQTEPVFVVDTDEDTGEVKSSPLEPPESFQEAGPLPEIMTEEMTEQDNNASPMYPRKSEIVEISIHGTEATEEINDSPVEEVLMTVPTSDDPTLPCLTIRTWVLGITICATLSFINQFFGYRKNYTSITFVAAQIKVIPLGKLMAIYLPKRDVRIPGTGGLSFSLNPGPFNSKEHCLISMLAHAGSNDVLATGIINMIRTFYHQDINLIVALSLTLATQMLGYGYAGIFSKFLVDSPYMWWPANLVQVSFFIALRENEIRRKGGLTRPQFFLIVLVSSFSYHIIPSYLFTSISALSIFCWAWKDSVTAQQIGAGDGGLGVGSFSLSWSSIVSSLGSPLATPGFAILNMLVGFLLTLYVVIPIAYWNNFYEAKKFPIISFDVFDHDGQPYNISRVVIDKTKLNVEGYNDYSKVYLSLFSVVTYGAVIASLAATLSHVGLFHGRTMWQQTKPSFQEKFGDVHIRLMRKNYKSVPQWWFYILLIIVLALSLLACEGFGRQLQIRYWGVLLAMGIGLVFTLPVGAIYATTNQGPDLKFMSEMVIGYVYPGRPLANVIFKTYGTISMSHAIRFLADFKLGHYMKIPPRVMFLVQLVGMVLSSLVHFGTTWWLMNSIDHICDPSKLPKGSPWTCVGDHISYNNSIIWGAVGPLRMFGSLGLYPIMTLCFIFGLISPLPVWYFARKYPEERWIALINIPIMISGAAAEPASHISWFVIGIIFNIYLYRRCKRWWGRYNYILSVGLDAGVAFLTVLCYFTLKLRGIRGPDWWGTSERDSCPLASCPTEPGIKVTGCPVFH